MPQSAPRRFRYLLATAVLPLALAACTDNSAPAATGPINRAGTDTCLRARSRPES